MPEKPTKHTKPPRRPFSRSPRPMKMVKVHAVVRVSRRISPDDWEVSSLVMDLDQLSTVGDIYDELQERSGLRGRAFSIEIAIQQEKEPDDDLSEM